MKRARAELVPSATYDGQGVSSRPARGCWMMATVGSSRDKVTDTATVNAYLRQGGYTGIEDDARGTSTDSVYVMSSTGRVIDMGGLFAKYAGCQRRP